MEKNERYVFEDNVICLHKQTYKKRVKHSENGVTVSAVVTFCKWCGKGIHVLVTDIKETSERSN